MAVSPTVPGAGADGRAPFRVIGTGSAPAALIERDEALAELRSTLTGAWDGEGCLILVRGEAGIGKTSLVEVVLAELDPAVTVLRGACDGVTTPRPFGPIRDMRERLGPELSELLDRDAERHAVSSRLAERLGALSPAVMVVEDVQWADEATAETLIYLARRLPGARHAIILTYRDDDQPSPAVRRFLGHLAAMPAIVNLGLRPLSAEGVTAMAAGSDVDPAELHALTGGNPFYVAQVLAGGGRAIPLSISDALRARLDRLGASARASLEAAAIIGSRIEPWLLAAVAGEDVLGADDCVAAGLLIKGEVLSFRHELTRLAVLEAMPVFRGIGLHRRALDVLLRSRSPDHARLAYHAQGAADAAAVLEHAVAAGEAAMKVGANDEAYALFERATRFLDHEPDEAVRARILELLSDAAYATDRIPEAYEGRKAAIELRRRLGDTLAVGDGLRHVSRQAWTRGYGAESHELGEEAVRLLEPLGDTRELAMAYGNIGAEAMVTRDMSRGYHFSQLALDMGRRLNEPEPIAYALNNLACLDSTEGKPGWEDLLDESLRISLEHGLFESAHRARFNLFVNLSELREPMRAMGYLTDLIDYTSSVQVERCNLDCAMSETQLELGAWDEAERLARAALAYARTQVDDKSSGMNTLARLLIRRGLDGADELLADADRALSGYDSVAFTKPTIMTRAEAAWLHGGLEAMTDQLREALDWAVAAGDAWNAGEASRWLWQAGVITDLPDIAADPYRMVVDGRNTQAAAEFDARCLPYEAALALAMSTDPADLRQAHDRLTVLGATAVAAKVADALRAAGAPVPRGPRAVTRANPASLTPRQLEIARLAAGGLTNREIAAALFLTEKTVAHHVSAVLAKLDVRRRGDIGRALAP
jgi:DNA-binding CsgD family transcriptional regulator/tetratricopeptide (TPR) repeat protein